MFLNTLTADDAQLVFRGTPLVHFGVHPTCDQLQKFVLHGEAECRVPDITSQLHFHHWTNSYRQHNDNDYDFYIRNDFLHFHSET